MQEDPRPIDYITIALVSAAVMLYQIALTRVLSVVVWYHFAFLMISLVMLGLGAPGIWFADRKDAQRWLQPALVLSGLLVPLSIAMVVQFGAASYAGLASNWVIIFSVLPVTLSLGSAVVLLLMKAPGAAVNPMYGADLTGAAIGAMLVIPLMSVVPTPHLAAMTGLLPLLCAIAYGGRLAAVAGMSSLVLLGALLWGAPFEVQHSKSYDETVRTRLVESWTPIARLTVFDGDFHAFDEHEAGFTWGRGSRFPATGDVKQNWLEQDGSAGTPITAFDGDLGKLQHLLYDVTTIGYQLRPTRPVQRVAIIGGGGGRDILSALLGGASDIEAVEVNAETIRIVTEEFGEFSGDIYHRPEVTAFANEGRSHLTHSAGGYDLVQISLIDSWAASAAGAYALVENNLYTVEAFELYLDKLSPRGMLATSRWTHELPRLMLLGHTSLEARGVAAPAEHMMLIRAGQVGTMLLSPTAFDPRDIAAARASCEERGFEMVYPVVEGGPVEPLLTQMAQEGAGAIQKMGLGFTAPVDDSPYFFQMASPFQLWNTDSSAAEFVGDDTNSSSTVMLQLVMMVVTIIAVVLFTVPLLGGAAGRWGETRGALARASLYFAAVGAGFMLMENMLLQHFVLYLGHPSYATTVIIASLLVGMGVGSTSAQVVGLQRLQRFGFVVPVFLLALVLALPPFFSTTLGWALGLRVAMSCVTLIPLGAMLGLFFPLGMERFGDRSKPWFWAVNGIFGVVASVTSLALSMEFGFQYVGALAAVGYVMAWLALRPSR